MIVADNGKPVVDGEWLQARIGKLTASRMKDAMDFLKNGQQSEARKRYMMELVAERMTDIVVPHVVTPAMEHGLTQEPHAKHAYMQATGHTIQNGVFVDHPMIEWLGCTPDSFVDPDGLAEFKCPTTTTHIKWIMAGVVPEEHKPQMAVQLLCTRRKWCDFASYDPRMPANKRLFIRRYQPSQDELARVEAQAVQFLHEVEQLFDAVTTADMEG